MCQRVVQRNSLRRIQGEHLVQQILQLGHLSDLVVREVLASNQLLLQVSVRFDHRHDDDFFPLRNLVYLVRQEVAVLIEMLILKLSFPYDLVRYLANS